MQLSRLCYRQFCCWPLSHCLMCPPSSAWLVFPFNRLAAQRQRGGLLGLRGCCGETVGNRCQSHRVSSILGREATTLATHCQSLLRISTVRLQLTVTWEGVPRVTGSVIASTCACSRPMDFAQALRKLKVVILVVRKCENAGKRGF
jgi:hypothetical protein